MTPVGALSLGRLLFLIAAVLLSLRPALAWEIGIESDVPFDCKNAPMNGADTLVVRLKPENGSFGVPALVGTREGQELWRLPFPAEEVNAAKSYAVCRGKRGGHGQVIDIASQDPGRTPWKVQRFRWNGAKIKLLGTWVR